MDFVFSNALGEETIFTHSADDLKAMIEKFGVHVVYGNSKGWHNADNLHYIKNVENLLEEFPGIDNAAAVAFFDGKVHHIEFDDNDDRVSIEYPIPEIGYE